MLFDAQVASAGDRGTPRRRPIDFFAFVRESGASLYQVTVSQLSAQNCRIQCPEELPDAAPVWLKIATVAARRVQIFRCEETSYRCVFDIPMTAEAVEDLVTARHRQINALRKALGPGFGQAR
jgi:hypothetical protein